MAWMSSRSLELSTTSLIDAQPAMKPQSPPLVRSSANTPCGSPSPLCGSHAAATSNSGAPPVGWLPEVRIPVTAIPAYRSAAPRAEVQRERVEAAAALLADVEIRPYPGADHDIHAQHPESLAADLLALAKRVR